MTTIQLYGRLGRTPEQRTTGTNKPMTCCSMVVDLGRGEQQPEWFSLVAFGAIGEALAMHEKSDVVSVGGKLTKSSWTSKDGTERSEPVKKSSAGDRQAVVNMRSLPHEQRAFAVS